MFVGSVVALPYPQRAPVRLLRALCGLPGAAQVMLLRELGALPSARSRLLLVATLEACPAPVRAAVGRTLARLREHGHGAAAAAIREEQAAAGRAGRKEACRGSPGGVSGGAAGGGFSGFPSGSPGRAAEEARAKAKAKAAQAEEAPWWELDKHVGALTAKAEAAREAGAEAGAWAGAAAKSREAAARTLETHFRTRVLLLTMLGGMRSARERYWRTRSVQRACVEICVRCITSIR